MFVEMRTELTVLECCPPLAEDRLTDREADVLAGAMKALADPARLRLLNLISSAPEGEACVCELTDALELSQPTISHHLKVLHRAGVIDREQRGRWAFYRVNLETMQAMSAALMPRETATVG